MPRRAQQSEAAVYAWSRKQGRYQYRNGRPVQQDTLSGWVGAAIESSQGRIAELTERRVAGTINTAEWTIGMREELRAGHRMMAHLAHGPELSKQQLGRLGAVMRAQYKYLNAFSAGIDSGDVPLSGAMVSRAKMYTEALWATWQNEGTAAQARRGKTKIINILNPSAEHCAGCLAESARGWVDIGKEVPIGARDCRVRDRCHFEYK